VIRKGNEKIILRPEVVGHVFAPLHEDEVKYLGRLKDKTLNRAKEILAYEATRITHGETAARKAYMASVSHFGPADPAGQVETSSAIRSITVNAAASVPVYTLPAAQTAPEIPAIDLFVLSGLAKSKSEARRLISQGGGYIGDERIAGLETMISQDDLTGAGIILRAGKKRVIRIKTPGG